MNPETAIIYARVSALDSQAETDLSLTHQVTVLTAAARAAGYANVIEVIERHTASKRQPELEQALSRLAAGDAAALFVHKIDRLSRKGAPDVLRVADLANAQGWRLVILDVGMDTQTMVGRLVLTILAAVAEMESARRSERMRDYHLSKRRTGGVSGESYGQRPAAVSAATSTLLLDARAAGLSYGAIAERLNEQGCDGRTWHAATVRRVFLNLERKVAA